MSFGTWVNGLSNTANYASYTLQQISKTPSAGSWRITAVNSTSLKANNLDDDELFITDDGTLLSFTAIGDAGQFGVTSSTLQINFADVVSASNPATGGDPASTIDYTAWM